MTSDLAGYSGGHAALHRLVMFRVCIFSDLRLSASSFMTWSKSYRMFHLNAEVRHERLFARPVEWAALVRLASSGM